MATHAPAPAAAVSAFATQCRATVGAANVRSATVNDAIASTSPQLVVAPGSEVELVTVLRCADEAGLAAIPRGGGTKLDWGNPPPRADVVISTARLDRVVEHAWADLTVTVEAGCPVAALQATLAEHGQRLAADVLWPERATIGGILATNDSGALRLRYGGLRDLIIGVTLALPDGTLAASGGKVVKNVAGYDLPKLATGSLGTLGIIARATFRLHPLPRHTRTLTVRARSPSELQGLMLAILDSQLAPAAVQTRLAADSALEADVLLEGTEAGLAAQAAALHKLVGDTALAHGDPSVWDARERLWEATGGGTTSGVAIAKLSVLPADLAATAHAIAGLAAARGGSWRGVVQATGLGWLRLEAASAELPAMLRELRTMVEGRGGSLVIARQPGGEQLDAWGDPGDAVPLMRALKQQLDPHGTLNPGRFVGGI